MKKQRLARKQRRAAQLAQRKRLKKGDRTLALPDDRRGSTIIVVIGLLAALMVLGFFFLSLASQENENAEYFKETAKQIEAVEFDPDEAFDCYLKQLILGAEPHQYNSVFYGGRVSLLPTMFGTDLSPFNGEGVNAVWVDGAGGPQEGRPRADINYDNAPDASDLPLQFNLMPGTQLTAGQNADTVLDVVNNNGAFIPEPDVDYVYPDHNFPMLTFVGYVPSTSHPDSVDLVLIPAGHRPQLMRNLGTVNSTPTDWYANPASRGFTFKAHRNRLAVLENGQVSNNTRFNNNYFTGSGFPAVPQEGLWEATNASPGLYGQDAAGNVNYDYEVNPAGRVDGFGNPVNAAIYHDCDFPLIRDRNTNQNYVVMIGAEILDAEGLLNLNVIGNTNAVLAAGGTPLSSMGGLTRPISTSNLGANPSEINPYYALLTDPNTENTNVPAYDFADYNDYMRFAPALDPLGNIPGSGLMANADWWSIVKGAPKISSGTVLEVYPGRYGEPEIARAAWESASLFGNYPNPGISGVDDNFNQARNWFPMFGPNPPVRFGPQPVDYFGVGHRDAPMGNGKKREFIHSASTNRYPRYTDYAVNDIPYRNHYGINMMPNNRTYAGILLRDDPAEMVIDPALASDFPDDAPFSPGESAGLHLSDTDLANSGTTSSLQEIAPWSFRESERAEIIRRRFTTISHDLKTHSHRLHGSSEADDGNPYPTVDATRSRQWEWGDADNDGRVDFPRLIDVNGGGIDGTDILSKTQPIRHAVFELLFQEEAESQLLTLMRKLNVNGVTEFDRDFTSLRNKGYIRQRGLVPHSQGLLASQLTGQMSGVPNRNNGYQGFVNNVLQTVVSPGTTANQEFVARVDRQLLARDIYTLLYLYGHGDDNTDTYSTSNHPTRNLYSLEQCREMAQFAVNMVDSMDADDVVTKFEYDVNLNNGWNLDDYPFTISGSGWGGDTGNLPGGERGVVFGVEKQQLSFNEGLAMFAKEVRQNTGDAMSAKRDHNWTEWNDGLHHAFLFMELQNTSGRVVTMDNREWEIVVRPLEWATGTSADTDAGIANGKVRHLILNAPTTAVTLSPGGNSSIVGIGSVSNELNAPVVYTGVNGGAAVTPAPSRMRVKDPVFTGTPPAGLSDVAPVIGAPDAAANDQYIDLAIEGSLYRVFDEATNAFLTTNNATDPAERLLDFNDWDDVYDNAGGGGTKTIQVEVVLRRRLDPTRTPPNPATSVEENDNPWIVVDRKLLPLKDVEIDFTETTFTASHFDTQIQSDSRHQPLFGEPGNDILGTLPRYTGNNQNRSYHSYNSIGVLNRETVGAGGEVAEYSLWHPHKNHEHLSLVDLFSVPLFGPDGIDDPVAPLYDHDTMTTELDPDPATGLGPWGGLTTKLGEDLGGGAAGALLAGRETFGHRVLNPWGLDGDPTTLPDNNRWHRVLEFLEVPNEIHQSVIADGSGRFNAGVVGYNNVLGNVGGKQTVFYRRPGVLNLNTIRDPEVLAGLMDDPNLFNWSPLNTNLPQIADQSSTVSGALGNDWWKHFVFSRDGGDPVVPGRALPGVPGVSRPFRGLDYTAPLPTTAQSSHSLEHTVFRSAPGATKGPNSDSNPRGRQLFQVGTTTEHEAFNGATVGGGATDTNSLDYDYKYRMLAKVMNNSTLRSNTFFVYLQADLFEAEIAGDGAVRVGAKLGNSPGYRGFFIIDRTKAMEMVQSIDVPNKRQSRSYSFNPNFNWRALVLHRQRLN